MVKARSGKRRRPVAFQSRGWLESLTALERRREPYDAPHRALFRDVLEQFGGQLRMADERIAPVSAVSAAYGDGPRVIEVGAGAGRLRQLLGDEIDGHWLHTEPDVASLRHFRQRFSASRASAGSAERLPVAAGTLSQWIGLCVLDVVHDLKVVASEANRALRPGGHVVHFLDMTTLLEKPLADLAAVELLAMPNVFSDPSDELWPQDLAVLPFNAVKTLLGLMARHRRPLGSVFGSYFQMFFEPAFDPRRVAEAFHALAASSQLRRDLQVMFAQAQELAVQVGAGQIPLAIASSAKHVAGRIRSAFEAVGFEIEVDEIRTSWELQPRPAPEPLAYRSLCVGHERQYTELPSRRLCREAPAPRPGEQLREAGVHVLVARRLS